MPDNAVGNDFAWFTDTASTSVNTVNAGDLKLWLEYAYAAESSAAEDTATWQPVKGISNDTAILKDVGTHGEADKAWEPGLAKYVQLKVKNDGNLSLKYKLGLVIEEETAGRNTANETFKLSNYLQAAILDGAQNFDSSAKAIEAAESSDTNILVPAKALSEGCITEGELYPEMKNPEAAATSAENATSNTAGAAGNADSRPSEKIITIVVYYPDYPESVTAKTSALNEVSVPKISIGVRAFAGQLVDESDSNGSSYDENATFLIEASNEAEFMQAVRDAEAGDTIKLTDDIVISSALTIDKELTIDLNGKTVTADGNFALVNDGAKLTIAGGTVESGRYVFDVKGGEVVVNDGSFTAQETVCALFGGSKLTVNGGTFTSKDNAVVATNGSSAKGCEINIDGGVFNANIQTAGYIACGVYVANKDTVNINAGTFNITDGVGVLMRAGHTTIGNNVVINLTNTGKVTAGKIGDANIDIATPSYLVMDVRSGYPGATAGFTITNNSNYELVEYK